MGNKRREDNGTGEGVDRRSYLKWAGAGLGVGGVSSGTLKPEVLTHDSTQSRNPPSQRRKKAEVLVGVVRDVDDIQSSVKQYVPGNARIVHQNDDLSYVAVEFPEQASELARQKFMSAVTKKDDIRYVEENSTLRLGYTPSDTEFPDQTAAKMVNADDAWDLTFGSSDVSIAVLDQGIRYDHPDLQSNMDGGVTNHGKDFVDDDSDPYPNDGTNEFHGTHVAGIAAAEIDNSEGVAGISQASVLSGRVANENHEATVSDLSDGISWATNNGADIINISLGGGANATLKDAVEYAYRNGVLIVAAAGNNSGGSVDYPAAYNECIAVSALTPNGGLAPFSSVGSEIELTAPGMAVVSTTTTDGYGMYSGTSMAAPVVSGVAALALSKWSLSNDELRAHLRRTAVDVGLAAQEQGYGRVDAYQAVTTAPDTTILEDFEDQNFAEYTFDRGSSGASFVSSTTYSGSSALEIAGTTTELISTSGLENYPAAGDTFSYWVRGSGGADMTNFTYGVQDHTNRYYVRVNVAEDRFKLYRYENASSNPLAKDVSGFTLSQDDWYRVEVQWATDGTHTATLFDAGGTELSQISASDSTWSSGGIGFDAYLSSGQAAYFDYVTMNATSNSSGNSTIEDFADSDLNEYTYDRGSSGATVVSSPTYSGPNALELAGTTTEMVSTSGLDNYPSAGETFNCLVRAAAGGENANFTYGVQDHGNRYFAKVNFGTSSFRLFRTENDSSNSLAGETDIGLSPNEWYEIEIEWTTGGDHVATLYDSSGSTISQLAATDETWSSGGIGFDAYLSSGEAIYFDSVKKDPASAADNPDLTLIDGFEGGDLSEYSGTGSADWAAQKSVSFDGSYAAANASNFDAIYNNSYTYTRGDQFEMRAYLQSRNGVSTGIENWLCTNANATKKYVQYVSAEENEHYLVYRNGIDQQVIDSESVDIPSDEWLRLKVVTDDTSITARVYDAAGTLLSSLSGTDTSLTSGGYGFKDEWHKEGPAVYVDTIRG